MENNPERDQKEITVTLPNGKSQIFRLNKAGDRVYPKGTTVYWSLEQFSAAKAKMIAAGATIVEEDLL
jgi:hypothetical protein